jgi:predicted TIM-barrel enzyme
MKFNKSVFGMIHLSSIVPVERAIEEIKIYEEEGLQGIIVENYHGDVNNIIDTLEGIDTKMDIGVNVLPNEYDKAFEIAHEYGGKFIQLDFVSGKYERNRQLDLDHYLYYRHKYKDIKVLGGVWPKYYTPIKGSNLEEDLKMAMKLCDAIVVTGQGTGKETPLDKIQYFRKVIGNFPLIIGAGLTVDNIDQMNIADGAIVGSYFKPGGDTTARVSRELVRNFMDKL